MLLTRTEHPGHKKTIQELTGKIHGARTSTARPSAATSSSREAQAAQENVFDYVEGKSDKRASVTRVPMNFVGDRLAFVREFVEKEREQ